MKPGLFLALVPTLLLTVSARAQAPAQAQSDQGAQAAPALKSSDLQEELDHSLHWLRESQERVSGSYGGVWTTIQVLRAFAEGPRAYRSPDGPFVSKAVSWLLSQQADDGGFADPSAPEVDGAAVTRAAAGVLAWFAEAPAAEARRRALAQLGEAQAAGASTGEQASANPGADARALLARRNADGSWGAADAPDRRLETATSVIALNAAYKALQAEEKAKASPAKKSAQPLPPFDGADLKRVFETLDRGAAFLISQAEDGLWGFEGRPDAGITAMACAALLSTPRPMKDDVKAAADRALDYLKGLQKEDGSIHDGQLSNYVTSASVLALVKGERPEDKEAIARARDFLARLQSDGEEGYSEGDLFYGGVGYGNDERPDLSNLQMALEALSAAGMEGGDPTFQKALVFLQRCQNRSESNDLALVRDGVTYASGNDGGAAYAPGDSKAGFIELSDGRKVPRSYGSMTYALLKSYLFAGLPKDDPRVVAAWEWLSAHYTLDVNPGFETSSDPTAPYQGLFYYFATMARALDLYDSDTVTDAEGQPHAWRQELGGRIAAMQRQDGSWVNENAARWFEGNPVLATAYAMNALDDSLPGDAGKRRRKLAEEPLAPERR